MLVLTRKKDERIFIGEYIVVTYLGIRKGRGQIGIEAPSHMPVVREEATNKKPKGDRKCGG